MADDEAIAAQGDTPPGSADVSLLDALRRGDERAFESLIDEHTPAMLRLALLYAPTRAIAEEVVQETWLGVVRGLGSFEGRSSLRTWIFRILVNRAKSSGLAERRNVHLSTEAEDDADGGFVVDPARFGGPPRGYWSSPPNQWDELPEDRLLASETLAVVERAVEALPSGQQAVFELRDLRHWTSAEVCEALGLTETNQRVLLHRARARVRNAIEEYFDGR
ncbi:MAG: RNA polymerase sigma factor [Actinomycetota bacterium]|nr:RNA polymerase sigma factor [Actinomycetota bacterium]